MDLFDFVPFLCTFVYETLFGIKRLMYLVSVDVLSIFHVRHAWSVFIDQRYSFQKVYYLVLSYMFQVGSVRAF